MLCKLGCILQAQKQSAGGLNNLIGDIWLFLRFLVHETSTFFCTKFCTGYYLKEHCCNSFKSVCIFNVVLVIIEQSMS